MGQQAFGVQTKKIREEVLAVALEHQLVSHFTSLVAVDVTPRRPLQALHTGTKVPNHAPSGVVPGVLPQGATPAPLLTWLGAALLLTAGSLWSRRTRA
jgi:Ca-activated chloride channel family protein